MAHRTTKIGVPYAKPHVVVTDALLPHIERTCPICDEVIRDEADDYGELITNNYGEHFNIDQRHRDA